MEFKDDEFQKDAHEFQVDSPQLYGSSDSKKNASTLYYGFVDCILSFLCSIIGIGIISIPYSVRSVRSISVSLYINLICAALIILSAKIYFIVRTNM